jgi:hypothetical protein
MNEEYSIGYSEGYQEGWNAAMDSTSPAAQRQWVGLTDEERMEIYNKPLTIASCIGAVEAKLKEKNT